MRIRYVVPIFFLLAFLCLGTTLLPPGSPKAAYRHHYQGTLRFAEEDYRKANHHFQAAYRAESDNLHFAMAYALSLARLEKTEQADQIFSKARNLLNAQERDYHKHRAVLHFFEGMNFAFANRFDLAQGRVMEAIATLPKEERHNELRSTMENALGYLFVMNQGKNHHKAADMPQHFHVHRRDLERAVEHFEIALKLQPENYAAQYNYRYLCDTLQREQQLVLPDSGRTQRIEESRTFIDMHTRIIRELDLTPFDQLLFMVDVSGSMVKEQVTCMRKNRFEVMKEMATRALNALPEGKHYGIGTIGGDCADEPDKWKPVGSITLDELRTDLRFLIPDGTTPLLTMLLRAEELFPDSLSGKKTIFLISDGANTCNERGTDVCEYAAELHSKGITVNILTFLSTTYNNTEAFAEYICLADNTNGHIVYMDNYRCNPEPFEFDLSQTIQPRLPKLKKSYCWGEHIDNLWMY